MDLRFVTADLRQLDLITTELLVLPIASDERPPQGTAGLVDYRLAGKISRLMAEGTVTGSIGQMQLIGGRPRLNFDRILLLGVGQSGSLNPQIYGALIEKLLTEVQRLGARRAVVELPGRHSERLSAEIAAEVLLELSADNDFFDTWTLIEPPAAQRQISALLRRDQRRQWSAS